MMRASFEERMKAVKRDRGYEPGDILMVHLKDIEEKEHDVTFEIEKFCGGGFAGQVYRARCAASPDGFLQPGVPYALKIYRPRSGFRRAFRNIMYWAGFQSPFPYHYNEDAVRTVLYLTQILKIACLVEFGTEAPINECHGTFWSDHVGACGEVHEWIEGGVTAPVLDRGILIRYSHNRKIRKLILEGKARDSDLMRADDEVSLKHAFMDRMIGVCEDLGLEDISRQVSWWTMASQPNVLTRRPSTLPGGAPDFVWVDRRPGLPGFITRINFEKLRAWPKAPDRKIWEDLVNRLESIDRRYRDGQLDIFGHNIRLLYDIKLWKNIRESRMDCWEKAGRIDGETRGSLSRNPLLLFFHTLIILIPFMGQHVQKIIGNSIFRRCIRDFIFDGAYRGKVLDDARAYRIKMWLLESRTTEARARVCYDHLAAYLKDWLFYFWVPASWQRFFTDQVVQWDLLRRFFTSPLKYVFITSYRRMVNVQWIRAQTLEDVKRGYVSPEEAERFIAIAGDRPLQQYITGVLFTAAVKPVSEISYVLFGIHLALNTDALKGLGYWWVPLVLFVGTISPAGILRFAYSVVMGMLNPRVPYWTAIICAPIRGVGDLAFPAQMAKTYPAFSTYLLTSTLSRLAEHVPVFGERGGLLSIWTVTVVLSWPASFREWLKYCKKQAIPQEDQSVLASPETSAPASG